MLSQEKSAASSLTAKHPSRMLSDCCIARLRKGISIRKIPNVEKKSRRIISINNTMGGGLKYGAPQQGLDGYKKHWQQSICVWRSSLGILLLTWERRAWYFLRIDWAYHAKAPNTRGSTTQKTTHWFLGRSCRVLKLRHWAYPRTIERLHQLGYSLKKWKDKVMRIRETPMIEWYKHIVFFIADWWKSDATWQAIPLYSMYALQRWWCRMYRVVKHEIEQWDDLVFYLRCRRDRMVVCWVYRHNYRNS